MVLAGWLRGNISDSRQTGELFSLCLSRTAVPALRGAMGAERRKKGGPCTVHFHRSTLLTTKSRTFISTFLASLFGWISARATKDTAAGCLSLLTGSVEPVLTHILCFNYLTFPPSLAAFPSPRNRGRSSSPVLSQPIPLGFCQTRTTALLTDGTRQSEVAPYRASSTTSDNLSIQRLQLLYLGKSTEEQRNEAAFCPPRLSAHGAYQTTWYESCFPVTTPRLGELARG